MRKIYEKIVRDIETGKILLEKSYQYEGPVEEAAGGMLTKQAEFQTAKFLNQVNDAASGGVIVSVPAGAPSPAVSQTIPGDRIVLDDATALALSGIPSGTGLTATQNLGGGVYMYVGTLAGSVLTPQMGCIAFFRSTDVGGVVGATSVYQVTADVQPASNTPTYIAGVFINTPTKGNFCWIQVAGLATVLFESALTSAAAGLWVTAKIGPVANATADVGAAAGTTTLAAMLGVAVGLPVTSTLGSVMLTRGNFCGRI